MTILYFVMALGILVFVHEFGHFIAAKKQGIGVEKFSLGFGPRLFSFQRGETTYMVSALPLGGYVKLHGEDPNAEGARTEEAKREEAEDPKSYSARPLHQRVLVVSAGPLMNLLLAGVLMPVIFMIGRMEPLYMDQRPVVVGVRGGSPADKIGLKKGDEILEINGEAPETWKDFMDYVLLHGDEEASLVFKRQGATLTRSVKIGKSENHAGFLGIEPSWFLGNEPIIDEVSPGSPAAESGILSGDEVLGINGSSVESWTDMSEKVGAGGGKRIEVRVRRGKEDHTVFLTPQFDEGTKRWRMGVQKDTARLKEHFVQKKYGFGEAIVEGTRENIKLSGLTLSVLGRLVTFNLSYKTLGGPIRIAQASSMAAKSGLSDFLYFLAFLSLQLGILNFLPFPVLDGGHLLFFGIETVIRRPVSVRLRGYAEQAGFVLLISLMLLVTLNDVDSVWGFRQILEKIGNLF